MMLYGLEDMLTWTLFGLGMIIVLFAQFKINGAYNKYKKVNLNRSITGQEVARQILDTNGLNDVHIVKVQGKLSDHYDPRRKVVRLSPSIFDGETIAAASVAAHEAGHAIQDKTGYTFMRVRAFLVPVVNLVTYVGYIVLVLSLIGMINGFLNISIIMISAAILFQLVTLPVEFDASKRAKNELEKLSLVTPEESSGVSSMLGAAALTYVASLINSLLQLLRLVIILNRRR